MNLLLQTRLFCSFPVCSGMSSWNFLICHNDLLGLNNRIDYDQQLLKANEAEILVMISMNGISLT